MVVVGLAGVVSGPALLSAPCRSNGLVDFVVSRPASTGQVAIRGGGRAEAWVVVSAQEVGSASSAEWRPRRQSGAVPLVAALAAPDGYLSASADDAHILRVIKADGSKAIFRADPSPELSTGWDLTRQLLEGEEGGIEFDDYGPPVGHMAMSVLGDQPPRDGSWFWALYVYGSFTGTWARQSGSVDLVNLDVYPHIAWVAVRTDLSKADQDATAVRQLGTDPMGES